MKQKNKHKTDIISNLKGIYKWGIFSPHCVEDSSEELIKIAERVKVNKKSKDGKLSE